MSITNHPKIEMLATSSLTPRKRNPRKHSEKQITKIAASISKFGFLIPVIVDEALEIVAGDARVKAAIKLGLDHIPAIRASFMTEADKRAFALCAASGLVAVHEDGRSFEEVAAARARQEIGND